ncbi:MAG: hypothetical protein ACK463_47065 [Bradyrhizobium sp.]
MMNGISPAMSWGMGLVCVLVIVVLILAAVALVKNLRSENQARPE